MYLDFCFELMIIDIYMFFKFLWCSISARINKVLSLSMASSLTHVDARELNVLKEKVKKEKTKIPETGKKQVVWCLPLKQKQVKRLVAEPKAS